MKRIGIGLLAIGTLLMGCKNKENNEIKTPSLEVKSSLKSDNDKGGVNFEQGALSYQMSFSDAVIEDFLRAISDDPLYSNDLAKQYISKLSTDKVEHLNRFLKNNPDFITRYGRLPFIKNNIYVAGYEAIFKGEGASYIVENRWNDLLEEGQGYVGSTTVPNANINFSYHNDFLEAEQLQINIALDKYDRKVTGEISEIAGYAVEKVIYNRKASVVSGDLPKTVIAYSSKAFNPVINKVMPYWVAEKHGILKLEVELTESTSGIRMIYQANMAVKRKLIEEETSILATKAFVAIKDNKDLSELEVKLTKIITPPSLI